MIVKAINLYLLVSSSWAAQWKEQAITSHIVMAYIVMAL